MLDWFDAIMQTGIAFPHEDVWKGWPERLHVWHVAQMQRPNREESVAGREAALAVHWALSDAVNSGRVPCIKRPLLVTFSGKRRDIRGNLFGEAAEVPEKRYIDEAYVTAADALAWLRSVGEEPTQHIMAWHRATSPGSVAEKGGQAGAAAHVPVDVASDDVRNLETLASFRAQFTHLAPQKRPAWPDEHVAIVRDAVTAIGRGGNRRVGEKLGMTSQAVSDLLKRHPTPKASSFPVAR